MSHKPRPIIHLAATALTATAFMAQPAGAQSVESLQAQITRLQTELDSLKAQMAQVAAEAAKGAPAVKMAPAAQAAPVNESAPLKESPMAQKAAAPESNNINVAWKGAPELSNADGSFKMKMSGKVYVDFGYLHAQAPAFGVHNDTHSQSSTEFRLLRFGIGGTVERDFKYRFEADFAGNKATITDAFLQWNGPANLTFGQFKPFYSLDEMTGDTFLPMMERPAYDFAFNFNRRVGAGAQKNGKNWSASLGLFNVDSGTVGANENGYLVSGRLTFAPLAEKSRAVHLGVAGFYRKNSQTTGQMQYKTRPEAHTSGVNFVDTGKFNSDSDTFLGLEFATVLQSFSVQAEYGRLQAHRTDFNASNPIFWGGETTISYFLTGEQRNYKPEKGEFDRVHVNHPAGKGGGYGALEMLGRIDHVDLEDRGIAGGRQTAYMLGLNWYANDYVKFMLNYSYVDVTNGKFVDAYGKNKVNVLNGRAQIDF